jgi:phosphonate transport system substrate-binding protein
MCNWETNVSSVVFRPEPTSPVTSALRVASCLAPHLAWFYRFLASHLAGRLGRGAEFVEDACYDHLADVDLGFVCSLAYVEHPDIARRFEPLAAPVLAGARYGSRPVYYTDDIVHRDSPLRTFADLRGRSWAYNEPLSQSGYGITRYHLACLGETGRYFGHVLEARRHERAIQLVAGRAIDAAAIDSHVLETYLAAYPHLTPRLRIIDSLGPSPIQPVVVRRDLSHGSKEELRQALADVEHDTAGRSCLARAGVTRFVGVDDATYDPIRQMRTVAAAAGLSVLH